MTNPEINAETYCLKSYTTLRKLYPNDDIEHIGARLAIALFDPKFPMCPEGRVSIVAGALINMLNKIVNDMDNLASEASDA